MFPSHTPSARLRLPPARTEPSPGRPGGPPLPGPGGSLASPHARLREAGGTGGAWPGPRGPARPAAARPPCRRPPPPRGTARRTARPEALGEPLGTCAGLGAAARRGPLAPLTRAARAGRAGGLRGAAPAASRQPPPGNRPAPAPLPRRGTTSPSAHCGPAPAPPASGRDAGDTGGALASLGPKI